MGRKAFSSFNSYRKILARSRRPKLGERELESVYVSERFHEGETEYYCLVQCGDSEKSVSLTQRQD